MAKMPLVLVITCHIMTDKNVIVIEMIVKRSRSTSSAAIIVKSSAERKIGVMPICGSVLICDLGIIVTQCIPLTVI